MSMIKEHLQSTKNPSNGQVLFEGALCGTAHYELGNIYHHLHTGRRLELRITDQYTIAAYYKGFKIGCLPVWQQQSIAEMLSLGYNINCRITAMKKKKFLPAESINVKIELS